MIPKFEVATAPQATELDKELTPTVHALGLATKNYKWIGRKGDLVVFLTQMNVRGVGYRDEPVLLIANTNNAKQRQVVFPLSQLWQMLEPRAMVNVAGPMAERLFGFVTHDDEVRVMDVLYDFADDLRSAPTPTWLTAKQWLEATAQDGFTITRNGQALNS